MTVIAAMTRTRRNRSGTVLGFPVRKLLHEDIADRDQEQADGGGNRHAKNHAGAHGRA
jgi:hypothetical protein